MPLNEAKSEVDMKKVLFLGLLAFVPIMIQPMGGGVAVGLTPEKRELVREIKLLVPRWIELGYNYGQDQTLEEVQQYRDSLIQANLEEAAKGDMASISRLFRANRENLKLKNDQNQSLLTFIAQSSTDSALNLLREMVPYLEQSADLIDEKDALGKSPMDYGTRSFNQAKPRAYEVLQILHDAKERAAAAKMATDLTKSVAFGGGAAA